MSIGVRLCLIVFCIGIAMIVGPITLPRSAFGELGHGDGMGLIGMIMVGAIVAAVGAIGTIIAAVLSGSIKSATETNAVTGEEIE